MMTNKAISILELPQRILGPLQSFQAINIEGHIDYNIYRPRIIRKKGISAMLRVKNEAEIIELSITSIANVFDEIIVIDNGSDDDTYKIVEKLQSQHHNIKLYKYPFNVSRCGLEHQNTDALSVAALSYFYNWCLSKCSYSYIVKWDADMLLSKRDSNKLKRVHRSMNSFWPTFTEIEIQTIYKKLHHYYLSKNEVNCEIRYFPNRSDVFFDKAEFFEVLKGNFYNVRRIMNDFISVFELNNIDINEFSHWDTTSFPTERKRLEYERYCLLQAQEVSTEFFSKFNNNDHF